MHNATISRTQLLDHIHYSHFWIINHVYYSGARIVKKSFEFFVKSLDNAIQVC